MVNHVTIAPWPVFEPDELRAVEDVLRSGRVNYWTGTACRDFEAAWSRAHAGVRSLSMANGSLTMDAALRALEIGPGDEVIVSPRSYVASAMCVLLAGATPVFADVDPGGPLGQEEIFGPVLAVLRARDFADAIDLANGTPYALTAGVFSRSPSHLALARESLEAGNIYLNRGITGALVRRQPFGGYRMSGIGSKTGGPDYLLQFAVPRTVTENTLRRGFAPAVDAGAAGDS